MGKEPKKDSPRTDVRDDTTNPVLIDIDVKEHAKQLLHAAGLGSIVLHMQKDSDAPKKVALRNLLGSIDVKLTVRPETVAVFDNTVLKAANGIRRAKGAKDKDLRQLHVFRLLTHATAAVLDGLCAIADLQEAQDSWADKKMAADSKTG
jgi:hypothetical protein